MYTRDKRHLGAVNHEAYHCPLHLRRLELHSARFVEGVAIGAMRRHHAVQGGTTWKIVLLGVIGTVYESHELAHAVTCARGGLPFYWQEREQSIVVSRW